MKISVIIVTYKAPASLKRCVESVRKHTKGLSYSINIVDNGSGGETRRYLRSIARFPEISIHSFEHNRGKAAANNFGVSMDHGQSDWHVILDDDAEVSPGWLEGLLDAAVKTPRAGILGCQSVYPDGRIFCAEISPWFRSFGHMEKDLGQRDYTRMCDSLASTCMLVRKDVFQKVCFWEELGQPYEDVDFCLGARKQGFQVLYCGAVKVRHMHLARCDDRSFRKYICVFKKWWIPCFPDSHPLDRCRARLWRSLIKKEWEEVCRAACQLVQIDAVADFAWAALGESLWHLGRFSEARRAFRKSLTFQSSSPAFIASVLLLANRKKPSKARDQNAEFLQHFSRDTALV